MVGNTCLRCRWSIRNESQLTAFTHTDTILYGVFPQPMPPTHTQFDARTPTSSHSTDNLLADLNNAGGRWNMFNLELRIRNNVYLKRTGNCIGTWWMWFHKVTFESINECGICVHTAVRCVHNHEVTRRLLCTYMNKNINNTFNIRHTDTHTHSIHI